MGRGAENQATSSHGCAGRELLSASEVTRGDTRRTREGAKRPLHRWLCRVCAGLLVAGAAAAEDASQGVADSSGAGFAWVDDARIALAEPGAWVSHGRDSGEQRYSPLASINAGNVEKLGLAWSAMTGTRRGLEATPLMVDGVLYVTGSWSIVVALDARTGRELWRFDPEVPREKGGNACCDVVNRGVAIWQGRVYVGTIDGRLIALDARTGKPAWEVQTTDPDAAYTITGAPRVLKGKVIIGNGGADLGVRGYFSAYDAESGALVWRFYTVPASREGPHEHPELVEAAKTWSSDSQWEAGLGGTAWDSFAYDPELDLLYVGVGNASVYEREARSPGGGDNLFLASILAVRPDTGRLVWHYQTTPGESWDYTATQHMILADLTLGGVERKVLMQAPKNGFFYVLDRKTGELLAADPYVDVSWASHVDLRTSRPVERPEAGYHEGRSLVTPGQTGGHNWHPMAFSPRTGLVYVPTLTSVFVFQRDPNYTYVPGTWNTGEDIGAVMADFQDLGDAVPLCNPSHLTAWDPVARHSAWRVDLPSETPGGVLATAGDLVFQGNGAGLFAAYDARTGERLWQVTTGIGVMAPPIAYELDGEQYVAVLAGMGGSHGGHFTKFGYVNDGRVLAFKLGGKAKMPAVVARRDSAVVVTRDDLDASQVDRGRNLYGRYCTYCHGMGARGSGLHPDLRRASRPVHEQWNDIVLGGSRKSRGMPGFADKLGPEDAQAIRAYVIERALHEPGPLERALRFAGEYVCIPALWMAD